jgi:hypothetical protein
LPSIVAKEGLQISPEDGLKLETELFTQIFSTADGTKGQALFLKNESLLFKANNYNRLQKIKGKSRNFCLFTFTFYFFPLVTPLLCLYTK